MRRFTLRIILPLTVTVAFFLVTIIAFYSSRQIVLLEVEQNALLQVRNKLNSIQGTIERFITLGSNEGIRQVISAFGSELDLVEIFVTNSKGQILSSTHYEHEGSSWAQLKLNLDSDVIDSVLTNHSSSVKVDSDNNVIDGYISICGYNSAQSLRQSRCGFLFYRVDLEYHRARAVENMLSMVKLNGLGTVVIAVFFLILLYRLINQRMGVMISALDKFAGGERQSRINLIGVDELSHIGQRVDDMLKQLAEEEVMLRDSEQLQKIIINSADFTIISTDPGGIIKSFNRVAEKKLGYHASELIDKHSPEIFHDIKEVEARAIKLSTELGETIEPGFNVFVTKARQGNVDRNEWSYIAKDGRAFSIDLSVSALLDEKGEIRGYLGVGDDLTERKKAEQRIRLYDKLFVNTGEPILITDEKINIIDVNPAYLELSGFLREEVIGKTPRISQSGHHDKEFYRRMWEEINKTGQWSGEIWDRKKTGEVYPTWLTINAIRNHHGEVVNYVGIVKDVSLQKKNEEKLERMAYYDPLTRLPNRQLFRDRLEQGILISERDGKQFALLFIDLDRFKKINDTMGHDAGDDLLVQVAERLMACVRLSDTVARMGGDEFNIIIPSLKNIDSVRVVAEKIIDDLHRVFNLRGHEAYIGASIGIAIYPIDGVNPADLSKKADAAMYQAKESGRGNYKFFMHHTNGEN